MLLAGVMGMGCGRIGFTALAATGGGDGGGSATGDAMRDADLSDSNLPAGLVAWFQMGATPATDIVGGGVGACTSPNCPTVTTGYAGSGLLFDGSNDCLDVADYAALHQATITVAFRAHMTVGAQDAAAIAKIASSAGGDVDTWELGPGTTNDLELTTYQAMATQQIITPDAVLLVGQWQHIAYTWDGTTEREYIDGTQQSSSATPGALSYDTRDLYIGCDYNGGPVRFYSGILDELQIYDRALSATEIQSLAAM